MLFPKLIKNLTSDVLDMQNDIEIIVTIRNCNIGKVILPMCCRQLYLDDSVVKSLHLNADIVYVYGPESGLEEVCADMPLVNQVRLDLADNQLTKFNIKLLKTPLEINISNNRISEIQYKIPFHWYFDVENNPIVEEQKESTYIDFR